MEDVNEKRTNFLVTVVFPENTGFAKDVDTELNIQKAIAQTLETFVAAGTVKHFLIADNLVINSKLKTPTHESEGRLNDVR